MRRRTDDAEAERHPVNTNVQKTADDASEKEKRDGPKMKWDLGPNLGIKHREPPGLERRA